MKDLLTPPSPDIPLQAFQDALAVVRRVFPPTPLVAAPRLSRRLGAEIHLKLDCLTPIRAFKLRGALNKLARLPEKVGVITASTGNHGLAVAHAARLTGHPATICVPEGANPQKVDAIRAEGARIVETGKDYFEAFEACLERARREGLVLVHAYDDPDIIAGQGTVALEVLEAGRFDAILCGVGGGGLVSGVSTVASQVAPGTRVFGVQPEGANSLARSLAEGRLVTLARVQTIADGLAARQPGQWPFALARRHVEAVLEVSDEELRTAVATLLADERIVAEPSGVAGLAAIARYGPDRFGRRLCVIISGANISDHVLEDILRRARRLLSD